MVAHVQPSSFTGLDHLAVQTVPDLGFVRGIDVLGGHADAAMHIGVVLIHQGLDHVQVPEGVGGREVAVQVQFQGPIETFGDGGFGISQRGKMTDAFSLQPPLDRGIVKFFALVRLQGLGVPSFGHDALQGLDILRWRGRTQAYLDKTSTTVNR